MYEYMQYMEILDWVNKSKLILRHLYINPNFKYLSKSYLNTFVNDIIDKEEINHEYILQCSNDIDLILKTLNRDEPEHWRHLSFNKYAIDILDEYIDSCVNEGILTFICWDGLCENTRAGYILEKHLTRSIANGVASNINWSILSQNKGAISILENNFMSLY